MKITNKCVFIILLLTLLFTSCEIKYNSIIKNYNSDVYDSLSSINPKDTIVYIITKTMNAPIESEAILQEKILQKGNRNAYYLLYISYVERRTAIDESLFYTLIMAYKYKHPYAYYKIWEYLLDLFRKYPESMDEETIKFAIDCLFKAAKKQKNAKEYLQEFPIENSDMYEQNLIFIRNVVKEFYPFNL
jgi:hypothetical protein